MNTVEKMILLSMKLSEMTSNDEIKWKLEKEEPISISQTSFLPNFNNKTTSVAQ
jgi:hypothetical protein